MMQTELITTKMLLYLSSYRSSSARHNGENCGEEVAITGVVTSLQVPSLCELALWDGAQGISNLIFFSLYNHLQMHYSDHILWWVEGLEILWV